MLSRFRSNVGHFFECFCEIAPPSKDKGPWIIQQFPDNYKDEEVLKSVPQFAYPCSIENTTVQHYSFVLTDIESKWTFGFCRHDPKSETALVVLSFLPWHQAMYKLLDNVGVLMHSPCADDLREFLLAVYSQKLVDDGRQFVARFNKGSSVFTVECPKPYQLPSIPENRNLTEYYNAVDVNNMIIIFASMLYERRIVITSKRLSRLSACVQSANDVLYPMTWQHIFIPVLPMQLIDYLLAPMPFLIGIPEEVFKNVNKSEIGEVVILNADANRIETPFDDLHNLPNDVVTSLKKQLKNRSTLLGDGVSRAFLRALVHLIGGYRDALKMLPGEKVVFDRESFIETRPPSSQPFLREMLNLQIFQQFIEERLEMVNNGTGFSDHFEQEVCLYSEKSSSKLKQQYKEWTSTMKKEGSAFIRSVKDKANPAMKSAVKTVKHGGKGVKGAYKEFKMKLKDNQVQQQFRHGVQQPRSAPNSPTGMRRFNHMKSSTNDRSYSPLSPTASEIVVDHGGSTSPTLEIPKIDLVNEMQDFLKAYETPPVDRSLKPVRSLENFKDPLTLMPSSDFINLQSHPTTHTYLFPTCTTTTTTNDTRNLLQSPEDVFSPPPLPLRRAELYRNAPVVVGGGRENGQPVFLFANQQFVDIVRLSPPSKSPGKKKREDTEDLIRLDSSSDMDEFDPLKSNSSTSPSNSSFIVPDSAFSALENGAPLSVSNPLYNYENHATISSNGPTSAASAQFDKTDKVLLEEYGIDFNRFSAFDAFDSASNTKVRTQSQWAKFE